MGDVRIENCEVVNAPDGAAARVTSSWGMTGGFVGYSEGMTEYDGLSKILGFTVDALETILNAVPGLGLGDLIKLLLANNILNVKSLIYGVQKSGDFGMLGFAFSGQSCWLVDDGQERRLYW
mgnify:CR=1 FL=1